MNCHTLCFTCGNPEVIWWKQEPSDRSSWGSGTVSLCGSHSSEGSSGRSSSRGNPRTRCAQRQDLPTPTGRNKWRSAILAASHVFRIAGVRFLGWRNCMKILFLLANWPLWGKKEKVDLAISVAVRKWLAAIAIVLKK